MQTNNILAEPEMEAEDLEEDDLDALLEKAAHKNIGVLIVQPANRYRLEDSVPNATWDPYFEAQRMVAARRGVPIFDAAAYLRIFGVAVNEAFLDELHPSGIANRQLAQGILLMLQAEGWPDKQPIPIKEATAIMPSISDPFEKGVSFKSNTGQD